MSKMSHTSSNNEFFKESFRKQTTLLEKRMDESIPWDQKYKRSKELFKIKKSVDTIFDGVEHCKQTIAKRTYFCVSHIVDLDLFKLAIVLQKAKQIQDFGPTSGIRASRGTLMMMKHHTMKMHQKMKEEYDIWAMEMEHYLEYIDNDVWKVIQNGNSKKRISTGKDGVVRILPPVSAAEIHAVEKERKARTILLMAIPKEHLRRFHGMDDAKEIWEAIRTRFGGNANSKKMQKAVFKTSV
ncbi:hypothetical protein Tco_1314805 [Tanacetum coccineum]